MERKGRWDHELDESGAYSLSGFVVLCVCQKSDKRPLRTTLLLFNGTSIPSPDTLAARPAAIIKSKAFSICSTRPEHAAVKDCLSQVKVTMVTAEVALDRVI